MPPLAIIDCDILTPTHRIAQGLALIEDGLLRAVGRSQDIAIPDDAQLIDARGGWLTPGLIDLAWQGVGGVSPDAYGITSSVQAVPVQSEEDLPVLAQAAAALTQRSFLARSLGLHLILGANAPTWDDLWAAADAAIILVTLSPGQPGAPDLLRRLLAAAIPCIFDWPIEFQPPTDPLVIEMLTCGLAAMKAPSAPIATLTIPHYVASPAHLSAFEAEGMLLASAPDQPLQAHMLYTLSKQNKVAFAAVLAAASQNPARFLQLAQGRLATGAPADLLCWTRFGELAWVMVAGETQRGSDSESQRAAAVAAFLRSRKETVDVQTVKEGKGGVDLIWRFRLAGGREMLASVAVQTDTNPDDFHFRFELSPDRANALQQTQADWYFYLFAATGRMYCLPVRSARAWLEQQIHPVAGGLLVVAVEDMMAALPRARLVEMNR